MSSLAKQALRRSLQRTASCNRYSSSQASSSSPSTSPSPAGPASSSQQKLDIKPQSKLPDEKMRVLVNLYHQSENFITKENLSKRIDDAFFHPAKVSILYPEMSLRDLNSDLARRRSLPKFGVSNEAIPHREGEMWSDNRPVMERAVMTTLYGVVDRNKPGFDALKDEEERIKRRQAQESEES
ncbi:hypothetical protein BD414DRAFT_474052 [Trametes punicea]|nr:hypothetical protein BD414DRAFT_474052 [Trametes punicea]